MRGGKRQGAGRKRGSKVKATATIRGQVAKMVEAGELMPLQFLLGVMREEPPVQQPDESVLVYAARVKMWAEDRLEAAKAAAPYCHARLANVEHSGPGGGPIPHKVTVEVVQ